VTLNGWSISPLLMAGVTAFVTLHYAIIFLRTRKSREPLTFAVMTATMCVYDTACAFLYSAPDAVSGRPWQLTKGLALWTWAICLRLATAMGVPGDELIHVRRGAQLHDIGKMGIPDSILLKPGPLTEDEWAVMRQHPAFAHQLLSPIAFLQPALDIPYCHHERWDGSGYPRGLAGEGIPLSARIFSVADAWDALCYARPYREVWPQELVKAYLGEESGRRFDPRVVEAFLRMVQ